MKNIDFHMKIHENYFSFDVSLNKNVIPENRAQKIKTNAEPTIYPIYV